MSAGTAAAAASNAVPASGSSSAGPAFHLWWTRLTCDQNIKDGAIPGAVYFNIRVLIWPVPQAQVSEGAPVLQIPATTQARQQLRYQLQSKRIPFMTAEQTDPVSSQQNKRIPFMTAEQTDPVLNSTVTSDSLKWPAISTPGRDGGADSGRAARQMGPPRGRRSRARRGGAHDSDGSGQRQAGARRVAPRRHCGTSTVKNRKNRRCATAEDGGPPVRVSGLGRRVPGRSRPGAASPELSGAAARNVAHRARAVRDSERASELRGRRAGGRRVGNTHSLRSGAGRDRNPIRVSKLRPDPSRPGESGRSE